MLSREDLRQEQLAAFRDYLKRIIVPYSAHYGEIFKNEGLSPESFRRYEDLQRILEKVGVKT